MNKEHILNQIGKALDAQFETYTWFDMINDSDLTDEEKAWAKENVCYKAYILEN